MEEHPWALTLIPFNGAEPKGEPNRQVLAAKKIPIFVMSPLGGGRLAHLNTPARRHLAAAKPGVTPAEWGMRYAASFEGMQTVLSGMSQVEQAVENVRTFSRERFEKLAEPDIAVYREAIDLYNKYKPVACTNCRYCECPYGIQIPEVFAWWNSFQGEGRLPADDGGPTPAASRRPISTTGRRRGPTSRNRSGEESGHDPSQLHRNLHFVGMMHGLPPEGGCWQ